MLQLHNQDYLRKVAKLKKFSIYYQYLLKDLFILLPIKSVFAFKNQFIKGKMILLLLPLQHPLKILLKIPEVSRIFLDLGSGPDVYTHLFPLL